MRKILFLLLLVPRFLSAQGVNNSRIQEPPSIYLSTYSITGMSSNTGVRGTAVGYTLTWYQFGGQTLTITAPSGFVVSVDSATFGGSETYTPGTIAGAVRLYVALASGNSNGTYSGNVTYTATNLAHQPALAVNGTTSTVASLSVSPSSLTLTDTAGAPGHPQTLTATFANLSGNVNVTVPTAPVPLELSINGGSTWSSSQSFSTGSPVAVLTRVTSGASAGPIADTVQFASTGVSTIKIPVGGTVSSGGAFATIVVQGSQITGSLTNFPVLISGTYTNLKGTGFGGTVTNRNNIVFSTNSALTSLLPFEIEKYDSSTGQIVAWVQAPSLAASTNYTFYLGYGNLGYSSFQGGSYGSVWGSNAYGIWHMSEQLNGATQQTVLDWGPNGHNLASRGSWTTAAQVTGQIGSALVTSGSNYFGFAQKAESGDFTMSGWFKITNQFNSTTVFADSTKATRTTIDPGYLLYIDFPTNAVMVSDATTTDNGTWTYLTITRVSGVYTAYHNGSSTATNTPSLVTFNLNALGLTQNTIITVATTFDEVQLWNIGEPSQWVSTSYNTQNSPTSFYTISF